MPRAVFDPRQMALNQTLQRNVFRKPVKGAPKAPTPPKDRPAGPEDEAAAPDAPAEKAVPIVAAPRVGPNAPCPCGSGKKSKKCCG